jgi:hypothetical protein
MPQAWRGERRPHSTPEYFGTVATVRESDVIGRLASLSSAEVMRELITEPYPFANDAYDADYDDLLACCDDVAGKKEYDSLLAFHFSLRDAIPVELKLYFRQGVRNCHALGVFGRVSIADFDGEFASQELRVFASRFGDDIPDGGIIMMGNSRYVLYGLSDNRKRYEVSHLQAPYVGKDKESLDEFLVQSWITNLYKEIDFETLRASRPWKQSKGTKKKR